MSDHLEMSFIYLNNKAGEKSAVRGGLGSAYGGLFVDENFVWDV